MVSPNWNSKIMRGEKGKPSASMLSFSQEKKFEHFIPSSMKSNKS